MADTLNTDNIDNPLGLPLLLEAEPLDTMLVLSGGLLKRAPVARLTPAVAAVPTVVFVTPSPLTPASLVQGSNLTLQATANDALGISQVEFFNGLTSLGLGTVAGNLYQLPFVVPTTGASLNFRAVATNAKGGTTTASTFAYITQALPATPAPVFINFVDDNAGGTVQVDTPPTGRTYADGRYQLGPEGIVTQLPANGVIIAGNLAGSVYAFFVATATAAQSPTSASKVFTSSQQLPTVAFVAPVNGTTLNSGDSILLRVTASSDGPSSLTVNFFANNRLIGAGTLVGNVWQIPYTLPVFGNSITLSAEATNADGQKGSSSSFVFLMQPQPAQTAPGAPTIQPSTPGNNSVTTSAAPPINNGGSPITSYKVYQAGQVAPLVSGQPTTSFVDTTAVNGTAVSYEWSAVNSVGEGARSAASTPVTPGPPTPTKYTGLLSGPSATDSTGVTLTTAGAEQLRYNTLQGGDNTAKRMNIYIGSGLLGVVDFPASYLGTGFLFTPVGGSARSGVFTDGNVTI